MAATLKDRYLSFDSLKSLTQKELAEYCFIDGDVEDWPKDINKEIENVDIYRNLRSLMGKTLDYMAQKIYNTCSPWLPENKKLNPKLLYALQTILEKDKTNLITVATTGKGNMYIIDSTLALTTVIGSVFTNTTENDITPITD